MKKIISTLSIFFICLSVFAQGSGDSSIEYKATTIIPTEFNGIKIGTPNIGKQLLDKGFIYHDSNLYNHPDDAPWFINNLWQYIEVKNDLMIFYVSLSSFKAIDSESIKYIIWARVHSQLSPQNESFLNSDRVIKENCVYIWTDSAGNQLFLIFWKDLCSMSIVPANHSKPIAHSNNVGSHEYVDLGLSVKWATCNVGASRPEEYGGYYQWAGLKDVSNRSVRLFYDNCPYHIGEDRESGWTKYNYDSSYGKVDNKKYLDIEDDVAYVKFGGKWRMPTDAEWYELIENCNWTWTTLNGVKGCRVQSRKAGYTDKWIFLPAAGDRMFNETSSVGSRGYYWSSSLGKGPNFACGVIFKSDDAGMYFNDRYFGRPVRPVCP